VVYRDTLTAEDYDDAILALHQAKEQPRMLQMGCAICHESGHTDHDVAEKGWKLAQIEPVGLHTRTPLASVPLETLKSKFINLVSPANMFVIPRDWGGLAESQAVIDAVKAWDGAALRPVGRREGRSRAMTGAISTV